MKKIAKKFIYSFIKCEGITAIIAAIVVFVVFSWKSLVEHQQISIIDWTMFSSIVIALILNSISKIFQISLMNRLEDPMKLTRDYEELASKYKGESMITYNNAGASEENLRKLRKKKKDLKICIPVILEFKLRNCTIEIDDSLTNYKLPSVLYPHFNELLSAHSTSKVYNQLHIKVDDWRYESGKFIMKTSRTTYFDSLVTNRAMDFRCGNGLTVRELFEFGPRLHTLRESSLSNHIGFNGFVESSDGYILFVKRGNMLSIGKRTYGCSVEASLKIKYALNSSGKFTESGIEGAILQEIKNELKIPQNKLERFSAANNLIAAYRDIVEGGKPQLLFFIRSLWTKEEIKQNFISEMKKSDTNNEAELLVDGRKFLWIYKAEIKDICILPDMIIYNGRSYRMMPSSAASIVMLIESL